MKYLYASLVCFTILIALVGCGKVAPSFTSHEKSEFLTAVNDGDSDVVDQLLIEKPGLVNIRDQNNQTPLDIAEKQNNSDMIAVLKKHGGKE